ncbi:uncharacterized protein HaLaN_01359 [Haematococcus lacustris]|uniref:Uncharacterized protein n=1 Tax=Haematococcus lacustris TaxID=44745 RepID=A0A699YL35_HAELA|nr:uncharacterized protein HaLaN_01359 [Haematococcus lacustris]
MVRRMVWSAATVQSGELRAGEVLAPLLANKARSEGLNARPNDDRSSRSRVALCYAAARKPADGAFPAEVHSQLRVIASLLVLRIFLTCLVGYPTPGYRNAPTPPAVQPPQAPDAAPLPPLPMRCPPRCPPPAPAAPTGPPMPLDSEDPVMLEQLFCMYFANSNFLTPYNQLQRPPGCPKQKLDFILKPAFDDPSNQELLAKLKQLGSVNLTGDHNTISHHSMQPAVAMQQHYSDPGKAFLKLYAKAARARVGWSGEEAQLFIKLACRYSLNTDSPELQACNLEKEHVNDLIEEAAEQRRLLALEEDESLQDTVPLPCPMPHAVHVCRWLEQWQQPPTPPVPGKPKSVGPRVLTRPPPFTLTPLARVSIHFIKMDSRVLHGVCQQLGLTREAGDVFTGGLARGSWPTRATQIGVGIDSGVTQAVSAASGVWDPATGQLLADQLARWKLTKGQVKHASGLNNARCATERWLAPIKPHLEHPAAASSAGTSLVANLKHITVTLATWDAVWEVYLDPKWARQRLQCTERKTGRWSSSSRSWRRRWAEVSMERHGRAKQLVVFSGAAGIGTGGGWGADAVLRACCKYGDGIGINHMAPHLLNRQLSTEVRTSLTRFRSGNSGLGVEKARMKGVTFNDRTCTRCTEGCGHTLLCGCGVH